MNLKFSGEDKEGQNNQVLETLRNKNRVFLWIDSSQFERVPDLP